MAPKALAPPMTEAEKVELARLLEKAKMDEDAERAQLASDIGYAKMSQNWATWKPGSADGSGSTTVVQSEQKVGNPLMSEGPMTLECSVCGNWDHSRWKSLASQPQKLGNGIWWYVGCSS